MEVTTRGRLVAILADPPLTDGNRTLRRVQLAAELLAFTDVGTANLFALPSHATGAIAELGTAETAWCRHGHLAAGINFVGGFCSRTGQYPQSVRLVSTSASKSRVNRDRLVPDWYVGDRPQPPVMLTPLCAPYLPGDAVRRSATKHPRSGTSQLYRDAPLEFSQIGAARRSSQVECPGMG
jgi:hypothetical protein